MAIGLDTTKQYIGAVLVTAGRLTTTVRSISGALIIGSAIVAAWKFGAAWTICLLLFCALVIAVWTGVTLVQRLDALANGPTSLPLWLRQRADEMRTLLDRCKQIPSVRGGEGAEMMAAVEDEMNDLNERVTVYLQLHAPNWVRYFKGMPDGHSSWVVTLMEDRRKQLIELGEFSVDQLEHIARMTETDLY